MVHNFPKPQRYPQVTTIYFTGEPPISLGEKRVYGYTMYGQTMANYDDTTGILQYLLHVFVAREFI